MSKINYSRTFFAKGTVNFPFEAAEGQGEEPLAHGSAWPRWSIRSGALVCPRFACCVSLILMKCDCTGTVIIRSDYHGYPHVLCMQRPRSPQCAMCVPPTYPCPDEGPWFPLMMHACMYVNIFISECAPLIACQIMNDACHPIMRCWAHPRNASDSERCDFVSPTINSIGIKRSIFMIGSRAHREREIILSRPLCEEPCVSC